MTNDITEYVVDEAKRIEDMDSYEQLEPLEVKVECSLDGTVREIVCVLTVGGPHVEVNVTNGTVTGYWGGDSHTTHVNNDSVLDVAHDSYKRQFEA